MILNNCNFFTHTFIICINTFLFMITWKVSMIIRENLIKPFWSIKISFYLCSFVNCFFIYAFFGVVIFEMHFLREQFWSAPMFWGSNFELHRCSEMHFLREQLFQFLDSWLLISMAAYYFADFERVKKFNSSFDDFKQITN